MIKHLRIKLAFWFFVLVMLAYVFASIASFLSINNQLTTSIESDLKRMCQEIAPAVEYKNDRPTLVNWMRMATQRHIAAQTIIQLFGADENLVESYGPKGIPYLLKGKGRVRSDDCHAAVFSHYINLPEGYFVQVQIPSAAYDQAVSNFLLNECLRAVPLALLLAIFGWFYSGRVVEPVSRGMDTLRNFVDNAAHELNTPIALIENSIETLEVDLRDRNLSIDVLPIIKRASKTLSGLSQKLLLLARMEQPSIVLRFSEVNIADLILDVSEDFSEATRLKQIDLQVHNLEPVLVLADPDSMLEVFYNLIDNALRHTQSDGKILIYTFKTERTISIAIRDTGCGIEEQYFSKIFDRFYRTDQARGKNSGGNGLGLAIVKAIVEAHKGIIRVESTVGKGTTFFITLPRIGEKKRVAMPELVTSSKSI